MAELTYGSPSAASSECAPSQAENGRASLPPPYQCGSANVRLICRRGVDSQSTHAAVSSLIFVPEDPDIAR
jgi:hypothetical protein